MGNPVKSSSGCAILDAETPTLWLMRGQNIHEADACETFALSDVIEAGLRAKAASLVGEKEAAFAECVADMMAQLRFDREQICELLDKLNHASSQAENMD